MVGATQLNIGVDGDRVEGLHQRVEKLGQGDLLPGSVPFAEIVPLHYPGHGRRPGELDNVRECERRQPLGVVSDLGMLPVEDQVRLLQVRLRISFYFLRRENRTGLGPSRWVSDAGRVVADYRTAVWPSSWNSRSFFSTTANPR